MISINNEELIKIIEEVVDQEDKKLINLINDIVVKIGKLQSGAKTSIAKLINYNPEVSLVLPFTQGKINYYVKAVCRKIGIELERANENIGGLAYFDEFIKN